MYRYRGIQYGKKFKKLYCLLLKEECENSLIKTKNDSSEKSGCCGPNDWDPMCYRAGSFAIFGKRISVRMLLYYN